MADLRRAREVFDQVRALPEGERAGALACACGGDEGLLGEVRSLLEHDREWAALESPPIGSASAALEALGREPAEIPLPDLPGYLVRRVIGEGGMGLVYEAEQLEPRRRVALKVLRPGTASRAMLRRFRHESEILGRLTHPGIARVYEAGSYSVAGARSPYFAMEFVDGVDLIEHATAQQLPARRRVEMLISLCDAVEHAHQRGVIHRDLKPSNVLVDEHDAPRVLDFGVARAVDADLRVTTLGTSTGELIGTLAYMSPEQISGDADRIDTRSDVYAIGAIAYELLSGKPAHDVGGRSLPDAIVAVRDHDVAPIWSHDASLRGDLGTIVMKALEKDPERRYSGASALADDLRRVLSNEPIAARAPTAVYQIRKFTARNRGLVTGVAAVFVVLVAGVAVSSLGLARALDAEKAALEAAQNAERETAIAQAVNDFLNEDLLSSVDPVRTADRDVTMREVLDIASEKVGDRFADQPLVEVAVRSTLAQTYWRLGLPHESEPHRRRVIELLTTHAGEDDPETIIAAASLATALMDQSRFEEAVELINRNIELSSRVPGMEANTLRFKSNLAGAYLELGRYDAAASILAETLEAKRAEFGDRDQSTLTSIHNLAGLYYSTGRFEESEKHYREAYEGRAEVLGEADPKTISSMTASTWALNSLGRYEESKDILNRALSITRERLDPGHPMHLSAIGSLANTLVTSGEVEAGERVCAEHVELLETHRGPRHSKTVQAMGNLASIRIRLGRYADALTVLTEVAERETEVFPEGHWHRGGTAAMTGHCLAKLGRLDQAEPPLIRGACVLLAALGADHRQSVTAIRYLTEFYDETGRAPEADALRSAGTTGELAGLLCDRE